MDVLVFAHACSPACMRYRSGEINSRESKFHLIYISCIAGSHVCANTNTSIPPLYSHNDILKTYKRLYRNSHFGTPDLAITHTFSPPTPRHCSHTYINTMPTPTQKKTLSLSVSLTHIHTHAHTYKQSSRCLLLRNGSDLRILNLTLEAYYCLACSPGSQLLSFCLSTLRCILMWGNGSLAIASSQAVQNRGHLLHSQKSQVRYNEGL